jgi:hypothetical protein
LVNPSPGTVQAPAGLSDMPNRIFAPIWIRDVGPLGQRSIESLSEAIAFLQRWPEKDRKGSFRLALEKATMSVTGHATALEAREAFWQFASEQKILAETSIA